MPSEKSVFSQGLKSKTYIQEIYSQGPGQYPDVVEDGAQVPSSDEYHEDADDDDDNDDDD